MARVTNSSHPIAHYATGGEVLEAVGSGVGKVFSAVSQPSKESDAAGDKYSKELKAERDKKAVAEGKRLEAAPAPVKKQKPYTNPDGTPWTREQMRKSMGR